jgi:hypothetical protein
MLATQIKLEQAIESGATMEQADLLKVTWFGPQADNSILASFGMRLAGGGAHQSKTMMFRELEALLATGSTSPDELRSAAIDDNALGKATGSSRKLTFKQLSSLYGLIEQPPLTKVFLKLWKTDPQGHQLQSLLVALARDPLLRETARMVIDGVVGQNIRRPLFEQALLETFPNRFSDKMLGSLARNCASSWTQTGDLAGAVKKVRQRVTPTPGTVAFAALLASVAGYGGPSILSSMWVRILDLSPEQALDHLRRAEAMGLARVRVAGDVTEISVRKPMANTLGVQCLEHV